MFSCLVQMNRNKPEKAFDCGYLYNFLALNGKFFNNWNFYIQYYLYSIFNITYILYYIYSLAVTFFFVVFNVFQFVCSLNVHPVCVVDSSHEQNHFVLLSFFSCHHFILGINLSCILSHPPIQLKILIQKIKQMLCDNDNNSFFY